MVEEKCEEPEMPGYKFVTNDGGDPITLIGKYATNLNTTTSNVVAVPSNLMPGGWSIYRKLEDTA